MSVPRRLRFSWAEAGFVATPEQEAAIWQAVYGGAAPYTVVLPDGRRATFSRYKAGQVFLRVDAEPPPGAHAP